MTRAIVWDRPADPVPGDGPQVRLDLAWPLFLPYWEPGSLPDQQPRMLSIKGRWFWEYMGQLTGRLRPDAPATIWLVCPPLTAGAREYVIRLASFSCDEVFWESPDTDATNHWIMPAVDLGAWPEGPLWEATTEASPQGSERMLVPMMGVGRMYAKVQTILAGSASARLHSHTA